MSSHVGRPVVEFAPVLAVVLGVALVLIGLATLALRRRKPALVRELWMRYAAWVAISAAFVGALYVGRLAWIALVALLSVLALREYARAVGLWMDRSFLAVAYVSVLLIHVFVWWPYEDASPEPGWYGLFMVMPIYATLAILAVPIVRGQYEHMVQKLALTILGVVYFGWLLAHFGYLHNLAGGEGYVLFLGFLIGINDVGAFVAGKLLGRHKLRPTLSPGKTVEGALGALAIVVACGWLLAWLVPALSARDVLVLSACISVAGTLGDLALSVIKRDLGIKDWSTALPGHGGVLDRANSLIFAVPLFFHIIRYFFA